MGNTNAKGGRSQRKTHKYLEALGFQVITAVRSSYRGSNDFFNRWDHIAVATVTVELLPGFTILKGETVYVQTKTNELPSPEERTRLADFPADDKYLMIWKDRVKEPRILYLDFHAENLNFKRLQAKKQPIT